MENTQENCKECGHENPKKFMGKEYTSHAPGCSQENADSTESKTMNEDKELRLEFLKFYSKLNAEYPDIEIADFWLNKIKESNKALLTKLRGEMKANRKECIGNPEMMQSLEDRFSNNGIDQDIALIDKYLNNA